MYLLATFYLLLIFNEISKMFYTEVLGFPIIKETFRDSRNSDKLDLFVG
ncbi:glyoxalase/bleomycin resistance protein/dioxygenase [Calothrix parasitica NIES-267]|uniref:Glyoxalase/bleomycin resistance protein/dioxygenase n=1 Tax=Calothrix parasitica NIES-267 TaxID=1973488 RepID=A0A1Z4LMA6_9CYAN|nr:glyoxalase/bleomycin resistance protein/dioxygenase [Calothrix parasitica NIES-267]